MISTCPLCQAPAPERLIWQSSELLVVWGGEADHPCLVQVIWQAHVKEMGDLTPAQKQRVMDTVFAVEAAMTRVLEPVKLNLASLGNWVPHVHWHIIPRWQDDAHWPNAIWAAKQRPAATRGVAHKATLSATIIASLQTLATTS